MGSRGQGPGAIAPYELTKKINSLCQTALHFGGGTRWSSARSLLAGEEIEERERGSDGQKEGEEHSTIQQ